MLTLRVRETLAGCALDYHASRNTTWHAHAGHRTWRFGGPEATNMMSGTGAAQSVQSTAMSTGSGQSDCPRVCETGMFLIIVRAPHDFHTSQGG
jgi:hypothetical protein